MPDKPRILVRAGERGPADSGGHPYDPDAEVHGWTISRAAGLARIAVNLEWLPPGKGSAIFHVHHREEEWAYVLSGRGVAELDGADVEIGPGDFLGFPPGTGHHVRNAGPEDLHLVVGGEIITDVEVADFPRLRRRMVRFGRRMAVYPWDAEVPFVPGASEVPAELLGAGAAAPAKPPRVLVRASERGEARVFHHPENPAAEVHLTPLSRPAGLSRVAVVVARVPAGRDAFAHHLHLHDEEWMYVLSGRGVAEIGDARHAIGPGDFLGFPPGAEAHDTHAAPDEDLVYLCGGDAWGRSTIEIVDFPRLAKRKTFVGTRSAMTFPWGAAEER